MKLIEPKKQEIGTKRGAS